MLAQGRACLDVAQQLQAVFLASAVLVVSVVLPAHPAPQRRGIYDRTTRGLRIDLATPRLRGLLAINAAVAAAGSMVVALVHRHVIHSDPRWRVHSITPDGLKPLAVTADSAWCAISARPLA